MKSELPFLPVFHVNQAQDSRSNWFSSLKIPTHSSRSKAIKVAIGIGAAILTTAIYMIYIYSSFEKIALPSQGFSATAAEWSQLTHLIILPGHAIQWCTDVGKSPTDESCWFLESFQHGQVKLFLGHVKKAVEEAANDPKSLLVISGGQTRPGVGLRTEAQSYFHVAESLGYFSDFDGTNIYDRTVSENFAKDSLDNVMFSVCRFKEITGQYPRKITVVGFPFKARRFIELHRKAINFPLENFKYIGVEIPGVDQGKIVDDAYSDFQKDLYGCGPKLSGKRSRRNPYKHFHAYSNTCPEMAEFIDACNR